MRSLLLSFFLFFYSLCAIDYSGIHEVYQDVFINNSCVKRGVRECNDRYLALQEIFQLYDRPFTILDIGAAQGYFCFRACYEYDATGVMIEDGYSHGDRSALLLKELCEANTEIPQLIILRKRIDLEDLKRLSECEHFDVVLALDMLPHLGSNFKEYVSVLRRLGHNVVIETSTDIEPHINQYVESLDPEFLGVASRHSSVEGMGMLWWFYQPQDKRLTRDHWYAEPGSGDATIETDFFEKLRVSYKDGKEVLENALTGINLMTYKGLNGYYPTIESLIAQTSAAGLNQFVNPLPWNLQINGQYVRQISKQSPLLQSRRARAQMYTQKVIKVPTGRVERFWTHRSQYY